jgi:hypothetical protein
MMTFKEFENATPEKLREEAKSCFDRAEENPSWGGGPTLVLQAQFYMMEMDRRENAWIARRDFWMEFIIIVLIVGELIFSYFALREGGQQTGVLQKLQESAAATASTLTALQGVTEATNKAIQNEYQLEYRVGVNLIASGGGTLLVTNTGHRRLDLFGRKVAGMRPAFQRELQWIILPTQTISVTFPELSREVLRRQTRRPFSIPFELYLRSDDGSEWVAEYRLSEREENTTVLVQVEGGPPAKRSWPH